MEWILLGVTSLIMGRIYYLAFDEGAPKLTILLLFVLQWGINFFICTKF